MSPDPVTIERKKVDELYSKLDRALRMIEYKMGRNDPNVRLVTEVQIALADLLLQNDPKAQAEDAMIRAQADAAYERATKRYGG